MIICLSLFPYTCTPTHTVPEGVVDGVNTSVVGSVVTVTWNPLPENRWNGIPRGYFVSHYKAERPDFTEIPLRETTYMRTIQFLIHFSGHTVYMYMCMYTCTCTGTLSLSLSHTHILTHSHIHTPVFTYTTLLCQHTQIYLYRQVDDERPFTYHEVGYPLSNYTLGLRDGTYYISIVALNNRSFSESESERKLVVVGNGVASPGTLYLLIK